MRIILHLAECEPANHPTWEQVAYSNALAAGGAMCAQTEYMANELFPDEPVWIERAEENSAGLTEIEAYAVNLVVTGAEHCAQDDLNEDDEPLSDQDWRAACKLGLGLAAEIKRHPAAFLAWYRSMAERAA